MWAMEQGEPAWAPPAQPLMGTEASMGVLALKVEKGHRVQTGLERIRHADLSLAQSLRPSPPQQATRQRGVCWVTHSGQESPLFGFAAGWLDAADGPQYGPGGHPAYAGPHGVGHGLRLGPVVSRVHRG